MANLASPNNGTSPSQDDHPPGIGRARTGRLVAWAVLGMWLAALAGIFPFSMELEEVQTDRAIDYLPASADSTQVTELTDQLPGGSTEDYVVIYHRDSGITAADQAVARQQLAALEHRYQTSAAPTGPAAGPPAGPNGEPPAIVASGDGAALLFRLPVGLDQGDPEAVVLELRELIADRPAGLDALVTGPSAVEADLDEVFGGIDETLVIATVTVVTILLILTYRSPLLWLLPLLTVGSAAVTSMGVVYLLVQAFGITVSTQSASILIVLVFGAGTDYALLLVSRYREELRQHASVLVAMWAALRGAGPAILASAGTVIAGLLCLLAADLNSSRGLGPVGAAGIACALVAMLTLFPALLVVCGRRIFWPRIPRHGTDSHHQHGGWVRLGRFIERRRVLSVVGSLAVLGILAIGLTGPTNPLRQQDQFLDQPESVAGFALVSEHFPELHGQPLTILTRPGQLDQVLAAVVADPGITQAFPGAANAQWAEITAFPTDPPETANETATIVRVRAAVAGVPGSDALVGGPSAQSVDQIATSEQDRWVVMPLVLAVVLVILVFLLRAVVAPLIMVGTVVLSYVAALGASIFVFNVLFGFEGLDHSVPLLGFLFLIALGVDYNIFLMSRAHQEAARLGTHRGTLRALATTGGVITSAGLVLAATFSVLTTLPLVLMIELGFLVAFGVLLDTFLVRSVLMPSLTLLVGRWSWWPSPLARRRDDSLAASGGAEPAAGRVVPASAASRDVS